MEEITEELLDEMMGDGSVQECEFVNDVAVYHPLRMLCELLGIPRSDEKFLLRVTNEFFAGDDEDLQRSDNPLDFMATVKEIFEYFYYLAEDRRKNPAEDLGSYIANGTINDAPIPLMEMVSYYLVVATAGHDTTRNAIAGGLLALLQHQQEMAKWQQDLELTKFAAEEIIRWTVPVIQFARTATQDYEIGGKQIKAGDLMGLFYASGSRDEAVIDNPFEFRIDRSPNKHVAFGSGPHICLGMLLARLEIRIFFRQLLSRLEMIELAGEPKLIKSSFIHGVKHLPIRYQLKPAA
jgi:cytochrome P450